MYIRKKRNPVFQKIASNGEFVKLVELVSPKGISAEKEIA